MDKITIVTCAACGTQLEKRKAEVTRQRKRNPDVRFFCNLKCSGKVNAKNFGDSYGNGQTEHLVAGNRQDEYSPFKYFFRKSKARGKENNLDLPYLKKLWEDQGGVCPLSGVAMSLPRNATAWESLKGDPLKPSLDRVDSSSGYVKGNVRFVTMVANFAKQGWDDTVVIDFCRAVAKHNP